MTSTAVADMVRFINDLVTTRNRPRFCGASDKRCANGRPRTFQRKYSQ